VESRGYNEKREEDTGRREKRIQGEGGDIGIKSKVYREKVG